MFVGPSGFEVDQALFTGWEIRPPIRRGDLHDIVSGGLVEIIAVVDGTFHHGLAVGHAEIRRAVGRGCQVWGLSSMGAIRACEMRHLGMKGFGDVYRHFVTDTTFSDDEVALLHQREAPYELLSEPLVHLRIGLTALVTDRVITSAQRRTLLGRLKKKWYGDRTLAWTRGALRAYAPNALEAIDRWALRFGAHRTKTLDLVRFLEERPWVGLERSHW